MRRRSRLAALAVIIGGTLAAATPAHAATAFSCIGAGPDTDNVAPGVELNVAFNGDFPEVVTGRRFTITPAARTVPVAIASFGGQTQFDLPWGTIMAASVVVTWARSASELALQSAPKDSTDAL